MLTKGYNRHHSYNLSILASFWKPEACGQTVLPDRSLLIGQKLVENAKIQKFKCDIFEWFSNNVYHQEWNSTCRNRLILTRFYSEISQDVKEELD